MPYVYIPAQTATTTGDSANVRFFDAATGGKRIRNLYTRDANGDPDVLVANGVYVIGATDGSVPALVADTEARKIYFEDTNGTRTLVATNFKPFIKVAASSVTKNANTTLASAGLSFTGVASAKYLVTYNLKMSAANTTGDVKFQLSLPSGASGVSWLAPNTGAAAASTPATSTAHNADLTAGSANGTFWVTIVSEITISTTAGSVDLQFAQNTSDASNTVLTAGSTALVTQVA